MKTEKNYLNVFLKSIISEQRQQIATTGDGAASIGMAAVEEAANVGKAVEDEQQINGIISSDENRYYSKQFQNH